MDQQKTFGIVNIDWLDKQLKTVIKENIIIIILNIRLDFMFQMVLF